MMGVCLSLAFWKHLIAKFPLEESTYIMDTESIGKALTESLATALNLPVFFIDTSKHTSLIMDVIRNELPANSKQQFKEISDRQLREQISEFLVNYRIFIQVKSEEKFLQELSQFLENLTKVKSYKAFLFVPKIVDFPLKEIFGSIKTITKNEVASEHIEGFWEHFEYLKTQYSDLNEDTGLWLECTFNSVLVYNLRDELKKSLQSFLGMLSLLMFGFPIDDKSLIGVIIADNRQEYIAPDILGKNSITNGWARFHPALKQEVEEVRKVFAKQKNSELERKLILSSKMYWLALQSYSPEITFISLISALESLLLGVSDRDYIGLKISEKVAFLMSDEQKERLRIYKSMKRFYDIRSSLVHGKSGKAVMIDTADLDAVKNVFMTVFEKVLNLLGTYSSLSTEDSKGLDDYINELRFK
jgi:Apea-like HEPN